MHLVEVDDIEVAYRLSGDGPPLVMIAGFTASMDNWDPELLKRLARGYRLLTFDNRGVARSSISDKEFSMGLLADDTAGLMEELGIDRAHVVGISMGGMIAQELAISHPERVDRLVLGCTYCGGERAVLPGEEVIAILTDRSGTPEEMVRRSFPIVFTEDWIETHQQWLDDYVERVLQAPCSDEAALRQGLAIFSFNASDRISKIRSPTLVVCGTEDVLVPPENSRLIGSLVGAAELVELKGAGHGFVDQCREEFAGVLEEFLGRT